MSADAKVYLRLFVLLKHYLIDDLVFPCQLDFKNLNTRAQARVVNRKVVSGHLLPNHIIEEALLFLIYDSRAQLGHALQLEIGYGCCFGYYVRTAGLESATRRLLLQAKGKSCFAPGCARAMSRALTTSMPIANNDASLRVEASRTARQGLLAVSGAEHPLLLYAITSIPLGG